MAKSIQSIQQLIDKIEKREDKRQKEVKKRIFHHRVISISLEKMNTQIYSDLDLAKADFFMCYGFLYGVFSLHLITESELEILLKELRSSYRDCLERMIFGIERGCSYETSNS